MKKYAFVDWDLIHSTPMKHTFRCGWRELVLGGQAYRAAKRPTRRYITIQWDGKDQLIVRTGKLLASKACWTHAQVRSIVFGLREMTSRERLSADQQGWLWFIHLTGKSPSAENGRVLAEFLVAHQYEAPSTRRARVPARVQELMTWLGHCTGHHAHGPILVTDNASKQRILSNVD